MLTEIKSIKHKADIVKVISHFIAISRDGANYTGKCPFHNEKSKSFTVSQSKGIFKCFGCGASGDVIDFVMKKNNFSYKKAIEWISHHENIEPDYNYTVENHVDLPISFIDKNIFEKSINSKHHNNFSIWLKSIYGNMTHSYPVGSSKYWNGAVVFWYVDIDNNVRSGKIMQYDSLTGKRVKEPKPLVTWAHKALKLPDFNMSICLFGESKLNEFPTKKVCIVESEKTAILASIAYPNYLWLASGSITNLSYNRCLCLINRDIILYPDVGAEERWQEKLDQLSELIPGKWSLKHTPSEIKGYDLCDYILDNLKYKTI